MIGNIIWTIAAVIIAVAAVLFGIVTIQAIRNWDDATTTLRHKVRGGSSPDFGDYPARTCYMGVGSSRT